MALPREYEELARRMGIARPPGVSDVAFMNQLDNFRDRSSLLRTANKLAGGESHFGMTSAELRLVIHKATLQLLTEGGFVKDAIFTIGERTVRLDKIVAVERPKPTVTVHYWILEPWDKPNNKGRANHRSGIDVLKNGKILP
jgi:hypothetical protein